MTLDELKVLVDKLIEQGKGSLEILASTDAEGNGFNNLDELTVSYCYENEPIHPDDMEEYEDLEEKVIIWNF